ncbi:MAG: 16S rRNA processing protein RimM [Pseudomonas fluorescens]|nr:MAG: 16S rRNA processing protein RimM [Pseudomonas fluorescens]
MVEAVKLISVGALKGPHGLKGAVKAKIGLDDYDLLVEAGPLISKDGKEFKVTKWQPVGQGLLALTIAGITTVEGAEALKGTEVFLDRNKWPEDEDEVFLDSLVGADVVGPDEAVLGTVKGTVELPAGPALEVIMGDAVKVLPLDAEFCELDDKVYLTELGVAVLAL